MLKTLYEKFQSWSDGGSIFISSDPHFADPEMAYLRKNYIGDEEQVRRINSLVHKNDTWICLGDVGDVEWVKKIKAGRKILIKGNHDLGKSKYTDYFDEVYEGPLFISEKILLSHEPIDLPFALNIHGHDHSNWQNYESPHINTCAEHIDYYPINLKHIIQKGYLKQIDSIHRQTIDEATKRRLIRGKI